MHRPCARLLMANSLQRRRCTARLTPQAAYHVITYCSACADAATVLQEPVQDRITYRPLLLFTTFWLPLLLVEASAPIPLLFVTLPPPLYIQAGG